MGLLTADKPLLSASMSKMLIAGEPAPWFHASALNGNPRYTFDTAAGRWIVMLFLGSGAQEAPRAALDLLDANRDLFDDDRASFFGVTVDPDDATTGRIAQALPGVRWFLDYDRKVSAAYGAMTENDTAAIYTPHWLLLDPMLRVRARATLADGEAIMAELRQIVGAEPELPTAPVLVVPGIFPPDLCRHLIGLYEANGGVESGFMRDLNGVTTAVHDHSHKRRADYTIADQKLIGDLKSRIALALNPMIQRAFQFKATRIERWIVACYDADQGGHFRAHRDNTTAGTAHRKFACTINLNAGEYEGGDLRFPEFGKRLYRAPTGGAVIFSCSLLHEARPVTKGRRYAFLPFLYDDEAARLRERNLAHVGPALQTYRSGLAPEEANAPAV
jgi:predicted 2-oxoglutarate/Fe(II)-dependent dioxygenase YbiX/peroxiredoxin